MPEETTQQEQLTIGRTIHVDVHAEQDDRGGVYFWHEWRFENGPSQGHSKIEVPRGATDTPIHFHLRDHTNYKLRFWDDSEECMWISPVRCPDQKMNDCGQITFPDPKTSPKVLKVQDANSGGEMELNFALSFNGIDGHPHDDPEKWCPPYVYDPIIRNGGTN